MMGVVSGICAACLASGPHAACGAVNLSDAAIIVPEGQAAFLEYAVDDLRGYLREISGADVPARDSIDGVTQTCIAVGPEAAQTVLGYPIDTKALGEEGFLIARREMDGRIFLVVSGATPRGTKHGLGRLMRMIRRQSAMPYVSVSDDIVSRPAFQLRGMHFNGWPFAYPYTFRKWKEQDWRAYIDILAYQGTNLLYLWPFMEIIPVPLSDADEAYLREYRRIVDYAQRQHGMEVWIMQSPNRVANGDVGVPDARNRPYWRTEVQQDLNPGVPAEFDRIMASREALYRVIDNVDGVCTIDSDPGWCEGSPVSDYVRILQGCRKLLDQYNKHGERTKLIHWMWCGWGHAKDQYYRSDKQVQTVEALKQNLPEPWLLVAGIQEYLPLCRDAGVLEKTVLLRYGAIEDEPSYPATNLDPTRVQGMYKCLDEYPEVAGVMGNMETPLLQFPLMCLFATSAWDDDASAQDMHAVLRDLAEYLYPEQATLILRCYREMESRDANAIAAAANELKSAMEKGGLGKAGLFGRKLFPDKDLVARSLLLQLRLRAAQERLIAELKQGTDADAAAELLTTFVESYLAWEAEHGWHDYWEATYGWGNGWLLGRLSLDERFQDILKAIRRLQGGGNASEEQIRSYLEQACEPLNAQFGTKRTHTYFVAPLTKAIMETN